MTKQQLLRLNQAADWLEDQGLTWGDEIRAIVLEHEETKRELAALKRKIRGESCGGFRNVGAYIDQGT